MMGTCSRPEVLQGWGMFLWQCCPVERILSLSSLRPFFHLFLWVVGEHEDDLTCQTFRDFVKVFFVFVLFTSTQSHCDNFVLPKEESAVGPVLSYILHPS